MTKIYNNLFLSIGAMKAGTTWLFAVLSRHPELHFALEKEIHYFYHKYVDNQILSDERRLHETCNRYFKRFDAKKSNIEFVRNSMHWIGAYLRNPVDDQWYRDLFQMRHGEVYACDFSNLNALLPAEAWQQISDDCTKLRVLYTMRDPIKRLWSHAKFHLHVTGNCDKLGIWGPEEYEKFVRNPGIWDNAEYGRVLRRLRGLPPETRKIIFYEDMHADQRGMLREIETFLGLSEHKFPQKLLNKRITEGVKHPMPDFFPELFMRDILRIRSEVEAEGFELPQSWG